MLPSPFTLPCCALLLTGLLAACTAPPPVVKIAPTAAPPAAIVPPPVDPHREGRELFARNCGNCHKAKRMQGRGVSRIRSAARQFPIMQQTRKVSDGDMKMIAAFLNPAPATPAKAATAQKTPAKAALAKAAPAKATDTKAAPGKKAPAKSAPVPAKTPGAAPAAQTTEKTASR